MLGLLVVQDVPTPLDRMAAAVRAHRSVSGTLRYVALGEAGELRFRFLAPGAVWLEGKAFGGLSLTDGTEAWSVDPNRREYRRVRPKDVYAQANVIAGYNLLLRPPGVDYRSLMGRSEAATFMGECWEGRDVIAARLDLGARFASGSGVLFLRIDPNSWLPLGMHSLRAEAGPFGETYRFMDVFFDRPLGPKEFRFVPPADYRDATTLPRSVAPPRPGDSLARGFATPDEWTGDGSVALRIRAGVRFYQKRWVFDLETRGSGRIDWQKADALVRAGEGWRFATLVPRPDGRQAIVTYPFDSSKAHPGALRIRLAVEGQRAEHDRAFVFEWRS